MNKLLSIVLPTYNRADVTAYTLSLWKEQILRNINDVEFIVCNNASDDNTDKYLSNIETRDGFIRYIKYEEHVDIGHSIVRSINNATSKYVLLWGDDDDPAPFLVDILLSTLKKHSDVGLLHFNRLVGIDFDGKKMIKLSLCENEYLHECTNYQNVDDFLNDNFLQSTLLSTVAFRKEAWDNHKNDIETSAHYGYDHYSLIMAGAVNDKIVKINYPLCIQRMPSLKIRTWSKNMGKYRLLGIPNMLFDMEKVGIISDAKSLWNKSPNAIKPFLIALIQSAAYKKIYRPLIKDIKKYQFTPFRRFLVSFIINLTPSSTYSILKRVKVRS